MTHYFQKVFIVCALLLTSACAAPSASESAIAPITPSSVPSLTVPPLAPTKPQTYSVGLPIARPAAPPPEVTAMPQRTAVTTVQTSTLAVPTYSYKILNTYPHDPQAYTEGLLIENGILYEGTGQNGQSTLRKVDLTTGKVLQSVALPTEYYGEGIVSFGERMFQLTWQSHTGFVYDKATFAQLGTFSYPTEGWGLTHDNTHLIMSDGTPTLYFIDPQTLQITGQISVTDAGSPVMKINELEYIKGEVYANIWQTDRIARIDPATGHVTTWIDLAGLLAPEERPESPDGVLNGIAYDAAQDRLYVTGKFWPKLFEIQLVPPK